LLHPQIPHKSSRHLPPLPATGSRSGTKRRHSSVLLRLISSSQSPQITMTSPGGCLALLLLLLIVSLMRMESAEGSCSAAGHCCEGKDNGCRGVVVYSNSLRLENLLYGNVSKKSCFCDSACVRLGDCCADYRDHCPRELRVCPVSVATVISAQAAEPIETTSVA